MAQSHKANNPQQTVKGGKCRFLPVQHFHPINQHDAVYSVDPTFGEQAKNDIGTCKTVSDQRSKKNAASRTGEHGAIDHAKRDISPANTTAKRVAKAIGYALTLGTSAAWDGLSLILMARLSKRERAALAYSALVSLDDETAYQTASAAVFGVVNGEVFG
ncbi:hypothetical protein JQT66_04405 [Sulfitobacter mediterraneus]|nr:hypothetical protein [Sulfitobacter mediterraneus]MBM1309077.1 hypothetical protein [Sulfitobacter mediterraneus]MBM1321345.1 hypothetical protein [Sulfitobacter mediterraneus]MBM1325232.1 hypothetical protein [Sulfitobacter mediterraneus]MBM1396579.1 hypothetical protein [Sulfitobacter mediterraneus]MBM1400463.1 hypothetical protein [Sulfitobacter mediterraneus]